MNDNDKIDLVQTLLDNDSRATDLVVAQYLNIASERVLNTMYPCGRPETATTVPEKYDTIQCEIAARLFARRGALGEIIHNENGVNRTWKDPIDKDLLNQITPIARFT